MKRSTAMLPLAGLLLAGCGGSGAEPGVPWEDYAPTVKTQIDDMASRADCSALQGQFDIAEANGDATMARTGHNNADLMAYIDFQMDEAGCYE